MRQQEIITTQQIYKLTKAQVLINTLSECHEQWDELQQQLSEYMSSFRSSIIDNQYKLSLAITLYFLKYNRSALAWMIDNVVLFEGLVTAELCQQQWNHAPLVKIAQLVEDLLADDSNGHEMDVSIAICFEYLPHDSLTKVYDLLSRKNTKILPDIILSILRASSKFNRDDGILDYINNLFLTNPINTPKGHIYCNYIKYWHQSSNIAPAIKQKITNLATQWLVFILVKPEISQKITGWIENGIVIQFLLMMACHEPTPAVLELLKNILDSSCLATPFKIEAMLYAYDLFNYIPENRAELVRTISDPSIIFGGGYNSGKYELNDFLVNVNLCSIEEVLLCPSSYEVKKALEKRADTIENQYIVISALIADVTKVIDELLKEKGYFNTQYIGYAVDALLKYHLTEQQKVQLQVQLYRALEGFNVSYPNRLYLQTEILNYCVRLDIAIPPQFADQLKPWDKVSLLWRGKNITWLELYPKLKQAHVIRGLTVETIEKSAHFWTVEHPINHDSIFFSLIQDSENAVLWFENRDDIDGGFLWFSELVQMIAPELVISHINEYRTTGKTYVCLNPDEFDVEWEGIEDFYFECQGQYYFFRIFGFSDTGNMRSMAAIVSNWMKIQGRPERCYEVFTEGFGEGEMYFSADPQYFDEFITDYAIPAKLVTFFQPFNVKQHLHNLGLLEELLKVREQEGYFSRTSQRLLPVPKAAHQTSQQMCEWLRAQSTVILAEIMMSHDMTHVIAQVVRVRNLFVLLARDGIHDRRVVDSLYKRSPLWGESQCQLLLQKYPSAQDIEQCVAEVLNIDGLLQEVKWCTC